MLERSIEKQTNKKKILCTIVHIYDSIPVVVISTSLCEYFDKPTSMKQIETGLVWEEHTK